MTTSELISYIRRQIQNNIPKDLIISKLLSVGWHREDIDEGFSSVDRYREPLVEYNIIEINKELSKKEEIKKESPKIETPPKVWVPIRVPVKEIALSTIRPTGGKLEDIKKEKTGIVVQNIELPTKEENRLQQRKGIETFNKKPIAINPKYFNKGEEIISPLMFKPVINSFGSIYKENKDNSVKKDIPVVPEEPVKNSLSDLDLPKIAMLSSYKSDSLFVSNQKKEDTKNKNHKIIKWLVLALVVIFIALFVWAFASGYINIKNLNIFSIKKDPKVLLLNNSKALSSLKSYKTETNVEISTPSFANISSGLISGEAITSPDKDSVSINTLGVINKNEKGLLSDNFITIKSSLLQNYITTDVKNNGSDLFVSVPDLSQIMNENAPEPSVVKINEQQFELIPSLFSQNIETILKKINIYKMLSNGIPSYINTDTLSAYDELINNVEIIEKGTENIKGIDTYHYTINADRQLAKKLLSKISDNFVSNLSSDDSNNLTQILGAVTIDSFDVWVGKGDNNIYQYNVVLDIPLSKIIGFDDKSIGDNKINIVWKTTYYDFNVFNNLSMPAKSTPITDFVKIIKKAKIKNDVSSFKQLATDLFNIEKVFGNKPNLNGSCMNPISGSLFSPTLHTKNATTAISSISMLLNKILEVTGGVGFCSSTSKAWSFTIPISDNYDPTITTAAGYTSFYCVDSTGAKQDLTAMPTGVICTPKVETPKVETNKPL